MIDILGIDTLFAEMVTGLGLALLVGNLLAWRKHRRGETPRGVQGEFRRGRVVFPVADRRLDDGLGGGIARSATTPNADQAASFSLGTLW